MATAVEKPSESLPTAPALANWDRFGNVIDWLCAGTCDCVARPMNLGMQADQS
jgi:hypothetical protein